MASGPELNDESVTEREQHYVALEDLAGDSSLAALLAQYVAPDAISADGASVECLPMREARNYFSVREARAGARIFSATRGENAKFPVVMIPLDKLLDFVHDAEREIQEAPDSLVTALAPSDDLPSASRMGRMKSGRYTSKVRFLKPRHAMAD